MTTLEKEILQLLTDDARLSAKKISAMLSTDEETVKSAIRAMEENGLIVKYTAIVSGEEHDGVEALIEVKVTPKKGEGFDGIARDIAAMPEVKGVYLMSGAYDLAIFLEGTTLQRVAQFVSERISTFDGVQAVIQIQAKRVAIVIKNFFIENLLFLK